MNKGMGWGIWEAWLSSFSSGASDAVLLLFESLSAWIFAAIAVSSKDRGLLSRKKLRLAG